MNSLDFLRIHDIALADTLTPDLEYHYRSICRWYSEKFHTPLHVVEKDLPPSYVVRHYYESNIASMEEDDIDPLIIKALNPNWNEDEEEDIQNFIDMIEKEEETKKGRPKKSTKKRQSSKRKKPKASATSDAGLVTKTFEEQVPPEADSDPDSILGPTSVPSDNDDDL